MANNIPRHYARLIRLWPQDLLRTLTFHDSLTRRLHARFLSPTDPPSAPGAPPPTASHIDPPPTTSADTAAPTPGKVTNPPAAAPKSVAPEQELQECNALYSLLDNRYSRAYPCSDEMMRPGFKPDYYRDLAAEMERAPQRSWLERIWLKYGRIVRMS